MKFDFSGSSSIDTINLEILCYFKKQINGSKICRFLDGVFTTFTILISGQNITIQGFFKFDYKSNDSSLFGFIQISHWKIEKATMIDSFL